MIYFLLVALIVLCFAIYANVDNNLTHIYWELWELHKSITAIRDYLENEEKHNEDEG